MSHLSTDRFAAIADDTPTADEATHLAGCWDCRAELAAYRRLVRMSAMAPLPTEPLTAWSQLAPQLRAEGIIVDAQRLAPRSPAAPMQVVDGRTVAPYMKPARSSLRVWAMRAAAAVALVLGGAAVGRYTAGPVTVPDNLAVGSPTRFRDTDDAVRALNIAQQQYDDAARFIAAAQDTGSRFIGMNQDSYQARLAALDEIAAATRAALYRAPQDPMLNQYYLTTLGAREATLQKIGAGVPASRRLDSY